jgi:DNA-directed RNA polymerase subunit M/transcription elongation factor TFIIS
MAWPHARQVEGAVYAAYHTDVTKYKAKVLQLDWNVQLRGDLSEYNCHALTLVSDEEMARGTVVEQWWREHNYRLEQQRKMLYEESKFEEGEQVNFGSLICNRCHSRSISVQQQQIRSADEGMTVFCTCNKCNLRWRM